uniref:Uncharacterized protein n=1 Tax=uncultured marine group II/III euryarchaeote KM3_158_C07 TaxID=1457906 RepID=A0A075GHI9_9EURY|nr:hypothetical protein [uncultured marine group II/III euryarchaeote KM3_158_C07]
MDIPETSKSRESPLLIAVWPVEIGFEVEGTRSCATVASRILLDIIFFSPIVPVNLTRNTELGSFPFIEIEDVSNSAETDCVAPIAKLFSETDCPIGLSEPELVISKN